MLRHMRVALVLASTAMFVLSATDVWAKGGRGGGRGGFKGGGRGGGGFKSAPSRPGGGGHKAGRGRGFKSAPSRPGRGGAKAHGGRGFKSAPSQPGRGGAKSGGGGFDRDQRGPAWKRTTQQGRSGQQFADGANEPWSKHHVREQRKLDHRRQVADHLRDIRDMNGNDQLRQVADDMDLRAQDHFDRQMQKINDKYGLDDGVVGDEIGNLTDDPFGDGELASDAADGVLDADGVLIDDGLVDDGSVADGLVDDALEDVARKLTGRENALYRQLRNEQRKLAQRMDSVERMRQLAQQSGDQSMLDAADRLEQRAMDHFDKRMTSITDFQQRHGLPDVENYLAR